MNGHASGVSVLGSLVSGRGQPEADCAVAAYSTHVPTLQGRHERAGVTDGTGQGVEPGLVQERVSREKERDADQAGHAITNVTPPGGTRLADTTRT